MEIYAELAGDGKKRGIKSPCDNRLKTMENGVIGTYIAAFSGYSYGKLFTAATKKRQSRLAWEEMAKFIKIDPDLQELFSIKEYKSEIRALSTNCSIEALSKESGLDDGSVALGGNRITRGIAWAGFCQQQLKLRDHGGTPKTSPATRWLLILPHAYTATNACEAG